VRAVNLIPSDARRGAVGRPGGPQSPMQILIGALAVALLFVTIYTLTSNTISSRKARLAALQAQVTQAQAQDAHLQDYVAFQKLAQSRVQTVREIAAARFDWHDALADLAKVVPANTSLQSLTGTVVPGAAVGGGSTSGGTSVRGDLQVPAFELTGCSLTQDDVAGLMSRLRLIDGVTRVTLNSAAKSQISQPGPSVSSAGGSGAAGCGGNAPSFDIVVFFQAVTNAGPEGIATATSVSDTTTAGANP
jgi:Tfp pilus assembly protein PilN